MTEGEVCPDETKSARNRPLHAVSPPYPVPLGQKGGSWFPETACSAIIEADFGSHMGNVG